MRTPLRTEARSTTLGGGCSEGGCSNHRWPLEGSRTPKQFWYLISWTCFWGVTIVCDILDYCYLRTDAGLSGRMLRMMMYTATACSAKCVLRQDTAVVLLCLNVCLHIFFLHFWLGAVCVWVGGKTKKSRFHGVRIILCSFQIKISVKKKDSPN